MTVKAEPVPTGALTVLRVLTNLEDRDVGFERLDRTIGRDPELTQPLLALATPPVDGAGAGLIR